MVQLSATRCSCIAIMWISLVSLAVITLCVASQRVFVVVVSLSIQSVNFWIHPRISNVKTTFKCARRNYDEIVKTVHNFDGLERWVAQLYILHSPKSRDSSVGIALGYGLDDRRSRVPFPAGAGNFSLHHRVQNGSGAHPASYPMGTKGSFPGG
jgi:hypothetical protein